MLDRRWMHYLALGGWLVLAILLAAPVLAQQEPAKVENTQEAAPEGPAHKEESKSEPANNNQAPLDFSAQGVPVQDAGATEEACGPRCQAAEQRENDDLTAQQSMATSTVEIVTATWWQVGIGVVALLLLGFTVHYTRKAAAHAQGANEAANAVVAVTREIAEKELRAYLSLTPAGVHFDGEVLSVSVTQRNHGQTPAKNVQYFGVINVLPYPLLDDHDFPTPNFERDTNVIAPGDEFTVRRQYRVITHETLDEFRANDERPYFIGALRYEDIYGEVRKTFVCWSYGPDDLSWALDHFRNLARSGKRSLEPIEISFTYASQQNEAT